MAIDLPFRGYWRAGPLEGGVDPKFYAGDRLLVLVAVLNGRFPKEPLFWEPHVIVATEDGWNDANGETWGAWSWDDVSWWLRLNRDVLPPITGGSPAETTG